MRFHWQNLNDHPDPNGSPWKHGRAWWHFRDRPTPFTIGLEWSHGKMTTHATLDFDEFEREVMLSVAVPGFSYYLSIEGVPAFLLKLLPFRSHRRKYGGGNRSIGVRVFDWAIWFSIWEDVHESSRDDPKWWRFTLRGRSLANLLFGKERYEEKTLEEREVVVPMPEKAYEAKARRYLATWSRPRFPWWPFCQKLVRVSIDIPGGVPVPGKGENSWDCGDDAIHGQSCVAGSIEEAIGGVVESAMGTRRRYGWKGEVRT